MDEDVNVYFVIPKDCKNEDSCSQDMQQAFIACEQHSSSGLHPHWVHENSCTKFDNLTKKDVYVLSEFKGPLYQKLKTTKCLLVGPRCLSCCLTDGSAIPPGHVFTIGMRGLAVSASGLTKLQKDNIRQKVQWMGGRYDVLLMDDTTHLVSNTVLSDKYIKAVEKNIPVMNETWVEDVWECSNQLNVNGASAQFSKHILKPFANLGVTTSGIGKKDKEPIVRLVTENGGKFMGTFQSESTDVVVLNREGVGSDKYKAAVQFNKICVLPSWIIDSAKQGVALPIHKYSVVGAKTSSPLHSLPDMSLNFSRITNVRQNNFIDESRDISTLSAKLKGTQEIAQKRTSNESAVSKDIEAAFENLDMSEIKKAGPIFDGYCIWVCGSGGESVWKERARAIVSRCGGVRYDAAHSRVTHVVAANTLAARHAARLLPEATVLGSSWLLDSVRKGRALSPGPYLFQDESPQEEKSKAINVEASPMSKRNLQLLKPPPTPVTPQKEEMPLEEAPEHLLHYLSQPMKEKTPEPELGQNVTLRRTNTAEITQDDPTEEIEQIFQSMKIEVQGLDEEALCEVGAEISSAGGVLVSPGSGGSHVLVPLDFDTNQLGNTEQIAITVFWIKDCLTQMELVPIEYYHRPVCITEASSKCLEGLVISLSTYTGIERAFLDELAKLLGAITQLRFSRRTTPTSIASTHLLCPEPSGDKYLGAVKWGFPAVTSQWLLDCMAQGRRLYEGPYLVGDTKAPEPKENTENKNEVNTATTEMGPPVEKMPLRKISLPNCNSKENTPKAKQLDSESDMSPASRYIAMARQGLLGETQETPKRVHELQEQAKQGNEAGFRTPPLEDALSTPNLMLLSPTTRRRLNAIKKGEMPSGPIATPTNPFDKGPKTPDSAFGAALRPGSEKMSPQSRKRLWNVVQDFPDKQPSAKIPTPLSEVKSKFLAQFRDESPLQAEHTTVPRKLHMQEQIETPPNKKARISEFEKTNSNQSLEKSDKSSAISTSNVMPEGVDAQLHQLSATLLSRNSTPGQRGRRNRDSTHKHEQTDYKEPEIGAESQPNTVGWDDSTPEQSAQSTQTCAIKRFMFSSNVDNCAELITMIKELGGDVCESIDNEATHLICSGLNRSEKLLCAIAAGRWLLHPSYITKSHEEGKFLAEEDFEWGNPTAPFVPFIKDSERALANGAYRWRVSIQNHSPGPYDGLKVFLHVDEGRRPLLAKLVQAGGGTVVEDRPPLTPEVLSRITVCLTDPRRCSLSASDAALLKGRVPVCPAVMLSNYLTDTVLPKPEKFCLNEFKL